MITNPFSLLYFDFKGVGCQGNWLDCKHVNGTHSMENLLLLILQSVLVLWNVSNSKLNGCQLKYVFTCMTVGCIT